MYLFIYFYIFLFYIFNIDFWTLFKQSILYHTNTVVSAIHVYREHTMHFQDLENHHSIIHSITPAIRVLYCTATTHPWDWCITVTKYSLFIGLPHLDPFSKTEYTRISWLFYTSVVSQPGQLVASLHILSGTCLVQCLWVVACSSGKEWRLI